MRQQYHDNYKGLYSPNSCGITGNSTQRQRHVNNIITASINSGNGIMTITVCGGSGVQVARCKHGGGKGRKAKETRGEIRDTTRKGGYSMREGMR